MEAVDAAETLKEAKESAFEKQVAIFIAALAVLLSICSVGGDNSTKDATRSNILASDTWAFYQAKNSRQTSYKIAAEGLELRLGEAGLTDAARKQIEEKIAAYHAEAARLESDPQRGEGKKELVAKAKELEKTRDIALKQDPYFDFSSAFLQIAIVLASASIVLRNKALLIGSGALAVLGAFLMLNGFTLAVSIPLIES
jgi:hypothetical protein